MKKVLIALLLVSMTANLSPQDIKSVKYWAYLIQDQDKDGKISKLADSRYDLLVVDNVRTIKGMENYTNKQDIDLLKNSPNSSGGTKMVICYLNIGQAESYRSYWQEGWKPGQPEWILATDPGGWEGNYPVKFWEKTWKNIIFGSASSMLDQIIADGYDGIYLDWVEDYEFEPAVAAAEASGLNSRAEMINFIQEISSYARSIHKGFIVIPQNAAGIIYDAQGQFDVLTNKYFSAISAVAQEDLWFMGGSDPNGQQGDIPQDPIMSEDIRSYLEFYKTAKKPVFTIDYATKKENVDSCYREAQYYGYIEYVTTSMLDKLTENPPPGLPSDVNDYSQAAPVQQVKMLINDKIMKELGEDINTNCNRAELFDFSGRFIIIYDGGNINDINGFIPGVSMLLIKNQRGKVIKSLTLIK